MEKRRLWYQDGAGGQKEKPAGKIPPAIRAPRYMLALRSATASAIASAICCIVMWTDV